MGARVDEAESRLLARMASARAKHAARWRFRSYVLPVGLVAVGLIVSAETGGHPGGWVLPLSPMLAAAVAARCLGGITAGRVAAALTAPLLLYALFDIYPQRYDFVVGALMVLIALCLEARIPASPRPQHQSAYPPADALTIDYTLPR